MVFASPLLAGGKEKSGDGEYPDPPAGSDSKWSLLSVPCDISLSEFKQNLGGKEDIEVIGWENGSYASVEKLERGRGYFVSSRSVLNPSSVCQPGEWNGSFEITFPAGWNLIGNPYHKAVKFSEFLGQNIDVISGTIFELRGNRFVSLGTGDNMKPFRGYWIYSREEVNIDDSLTMRLSIKASGGFNADTEITSTIRVPVEGRLNFTAAMEYYDGDSLEKSVEVTDIADWIISDESIGSISREGVFLPEKAGETAVSAEAWGYESNTLTVEIIEKDEIECNKMVLAFAPVKYHGTDDQLGLFFYMLMNMNQEFCYEIPHWWKEKLHLKFAGDPKRIVECASSYDHFMTPWHPVGSNLKIQAVCVGDGERSFGPSIDIFAYPYLWNISDVVEWEIADKDVLEDLGGGTFNAQSEGTTTVSATYKSSDNNILKDEIQVVTDKIEFKEISIRWTKKHSSLRNICDIFGYSSDYDCDEYFISEGEKASLAAMGRYTADYRFFRLLYSGTDCMTGDIAITSMVNWTSTNAEAGFVDNTGVFNALASGTAKISANLNNVTSNTLSINIVPENRLFFIAAQPAGGMKLEPGSDASVKATAYFIDSEDSSCENVYYDYSCNYRKVDVTEEAEWTVSDPAIGTVEDGTFSAADYGKGEIFAEYKGLKSNSISVEVADINYMVLGIKGPGDKTLYGCPYQQCYYGKAGESMQFEVWGREGNYWREQTYDITSQATWEISDTSIAKIENGRLGAKSRGLVWIRATVGDARSDKAWVAVTDDEEYEFLMIGVENYYSFKPMKPLKAGDSYYFKAVHFEYFPDGIETEDCYYDCYQEKEFFNSYNENILYSDISQEVAWNLSDSSVASISDYGRLTGTEQGFVDVSAEYKGMTSNTVTVDVWDDQDMMFCDAANVNSADWNDEHTKATLETDCRQYSPGESVHIRYTAEVDSSRAWYLDNCLDLYVMDENDNIVRTFREEGCSTEPLGRSSARALEPVFQYLASWDMKDDSGNTVPEGRYYAVARFYILWEPVIRLPFDIVSQGSE